MRPSAELLKALLESFGFDVQSYYSEASFVQAMILEID